MMELPKRHATPFIGPAGSLRVRVRLRRCAGPSPSLAGPPGLRLPNAALTEGSGRILRGPWCPVAPECHSASDSEGPA